MNEQWIQQMQQKMAGYEHPAPELPWDEVHRVLSANKHRRARQIWLRRMAAAAVFLLIAGVGYWRFQDHQTDPMQPATGSATALVEDQAPGAYDGQPVRPTDMAPMPSDVRLKDTSPQPEMIAMSEPEVVTVHAIVPDTVNTPAPTNEANLPSNKESDNRPKGQTSPPPVIYPSDLQHRKHSDSRLTAQVYMSSTMSGSQEQVRSILNTNSSFSGTTQSQSGTHARHRQPLRFGLSLRYRFDDRWSMESGLTYTHLSSDITTVTDGESATTVQRLNYLGLPVNIGYGLWRTRHFSLYLSAGAMIEKSLNTSPWQFSLNGAIGAEYQLTDFFSLYAEPGLGYYFKDGSTTPTIYQDHPLNFNLSLGLRFNLNK